VGGRGGVGVVVARMVALLSAVEMRECGEARSVLDAGDARCGCGCEVPSTGVQALSAAYGGCARRLCAARGRGPEAGSGGAPPSLLTGAPGECRDGQDYSARWLDEQASCSRVPIAETRFSSTSSASRGSLEYAWMSAHLPV